MLYIPTFISIIVVLLFTVPVLLTVAFVIVAERKTMASMQRRLGLNVVGYYQLLQANAMAFVYRLSHLVLRLFSYIVYALRIIIEFLFFYILATLFLSFLVYVFVHILIYVDPTYSYLLYPPELCISNLDRFSNWNGYSNVQIGLFIQDYYTAWNYHNSKAMQGFYSVKVIDHFNSYPGAYSADSLAILNSVLGHLKVTSQEQLLSNETGVPGQVYHFAFKDHLEALSDSKNPRA